MDCFNDPISGSRTAAAPVLVFKHDRDVQLSVRGTLDFKDTFEFGALFAHRSADSHAKLGIERSLSGKMMVVSVVSKVFSDDAGRAILQKFDTAYTACGPSRRSLSRAQLLLLMRRSNWPISRSSENTPGKDCVSAAFLP